jgi:pimeloyl-ACP methyl ester carboxylesterase
MSEQEPSSNLAVSKVQVGGINVSYGQTGAGPELVLIHGLTGSLADWESRGLPFLTNRFRVLVYDLRGHGSSDMPPSGYTSADMAADLAGLMDAIGINRAHIVGHSFGGVIALHFAALHPDRTIGVTVSDSRLHSLQPIQKVKDWIYWPIWEQQLKERGLSLDAEGELDFTVIELLLAQRLSQGHEDMAEVDRGRAERWMKLLSSTTARHDLKDPAGLTADLIQQIYVPTHLVYGGLSFGLPTCEKLKQLIPDAKSTIIPGAGHFYPATRPKVFADEIASFHTSIYK